MSRDEIISEVVNDSEYKKICRKIWNRDYEDLYQELILILCEYNHKRLEQIYSASNGKLFRFFVIRIAFNMARNKYSDFYKNFVDNFLISNEYLPELSDSTLEVDFTELYNMAVKELKQYERDYAGNYPYDVKVLEGYIHHGSTHKLKRATGIPYKSIQQALVRIKKRINQNVNPADFIN